MNLEDIIARYAEDRNSLSEEEFAFLVEHMEQDPDLAARIKDQLVLDDMLSREVGEDRLNFMEQVAERLKDEKSDEAQKFVKQTMQRARKKRTARPARKSPLGWLIPLTAAAAVLVAFLYFRDTETPAGTPPIFPDMDKIIGMVEGQGTVVHRGQTVIQAVPGGIAVNEDDIIRVAPAGFAKMVFNNKEVLACREGSELAFFQGRGHFPEVNIRKGEIFFEGPATGEERKFTTAHAEIVLLSTQINVVAAAENTTLALARGAAQYKARSAGAQVKVDTGFEVTASSESRDLEKRLTPSDIAARLAWLNAHGIAYNVPPYTPPPEPKKVKVAVIQVELKDIVKPGVDSARIGQLIRDAADQGAKLVVLPALSFANELDDEQKILGNAIPMDGSLVTSIRSLAKKHSIYIAFGLREKVSAVMTGNTALLIDDKGEIILKQRKIELASRETAFTRAGTRTMPVKTPFGTVIMLISKDVHSGDAFEKARLLDFDLLLVLNSDSDYTRYQLLLGNLVKARNCAVLMANHASKGNGGRSAIFLPDSSRQDITPSNREGLLITEVAVPE